MVKPKDIKKGHYYIVNTDHYKYIIKAITDPYYERGEYGCEVKVFYESFKYSKRSYADIHNRQIVFYKENNPVIKEINGEIYETLYN